MESLLINFEQPIIKLTSTNSTEYINEVLNATGQIFELESLKVIICETRKSKSIGLK